MPDFRQAVKLNKIPVVGFVPEASSSAPSSPVDGQQWYDLTNHLLKVWNSGTSAWVTCELGPGSIFDAMVNSAAAIAESKLSLATDASAGTGSRRTLGFGSAQAMQGTSTLSGIAAANANSGDVALNAHRLTGVQDPSGTTTQDAATANWVTNQIATQVNGLDWKDAAEWATAAALPANTYSSGPQTLTANANGALSVDGNAVSVNDRILVKNEATGANNGLYTVTAAGAGGSAYILTRTADANSSAGVQSAAVPVMGGTANSGTIWMQTALAVTLDTTSLVFTQVGTLYLAGTGLSLSDSTFSLQVPVTVANGGTNSTTASGARTSLSAAGTYTSGTIGDGASTTLTVTHNLNNRYPSGVTAWDVSGANPIIVNVDVTATTVNAVTLGFAVAPVSNSIVCSVSG
jgi:hypothetical protein